MMEPLPGSQILQQVRSDCERYGAISILGNLETASREHTQITVVVDQLHEALLAAHSTINKADERTTHSASHCTATDNSAREADSYSPIDDIVTCYLSRMQHPPPDTLLKFPSCTPLPWILIMSWIVKRNLPGAATRFLNFYVQPAAQIAPGGGDQRRLGSEAPGLASLMVFLPFPSHHSATCDESTPPVNSTARVHLERYEYPATLIRSASNFGSESPLDRGAQTNELVSNTQLCLCAPGEDEKTAPECSPPTSQASDAQITHTVTTTPPVDGNSAGRAESEDNSDHSSDLSSAFYGNFSEAYAQSSICIPTFKPFPIVPVVCIIREGSEIVPFMLSALSQKQVLQHGLPIIGILYDTSHEICRVFLGWQGPMNDTMDPAPKLHIAAASEDSAAPNMIGASPCGIFNLRSRLDALALAHFLDLLSRHAGSIKSRWASFARPLPTGTVSPNVTATVPTTQPWRADTVAELPTGGDCPLSTAVLQWRIDVEPFCNPQWPGIMESDHERSTPPFSTMPDDTEVCSSTNNNYPT
ncbi:hypothetical protein C8Q78DRAFT_558188 [Trametes maxima]|nr:hypothetical protein C8Q78DRAFT_558188 [Trametes maxima]